MKPLLITLATLALLSLGTQLLRHVYVAAVAPRTSILDQYDEPTEKDIAASQTLEELVRQYEAARQAVQKREAGLTQAEKDQLAHTAEQHTAERKWKAAVEAWESRSREINELHFFWWAGAACLPLALACARWVDRWLAVAALAVGFAEMIYWTSPTFRIFGGGAEFDRLLLWKVIYTAASLVLLLGLWVGLARRYGRPA